ncbi:predicted protein [Naegleria gruberi]|uniref:Predicted protein n=1 Tax=Naegleria gruberi TaxID=5762 RepID=D2V5A1_NAEGR|nr:uncharacterized protein NAEGRDRAFT_46820 [Naegleria gruberi]EFC48239.1 predicted protein [Naegleria gruberi]|eukprot:XP_002680983.1 predicted protein [Naegleria gruberi strain NEG-M]
MNINQWKKPSSSSINKIIKPTVSSSSLESSFKKLSSSSLESNKQINEISIEKKKVNKQQQQQTLPSESWAPIQIDQCLNGMHEHSAPCLHKHYLMKNNQTNNYTNLERGIELIYHSFKIKAPKFYNNEQKMEWMEKSKRIKMMKWAPDLEWAIYFSTNGQILVFNNVYIDAIIDSDKWSAGSCMGDSHSHLPFFKTKPSMKTFIRKYNHLPNNLSYLKNPNVKVTTGPNDVKTVEIQLEEDYERLDTVILCTSPDSYSFQHFLDRVTVTWSQAMIYQQDESSPNGSTSILSGLQSYNPVIKQFYSFMVDKHYHQQSIHAKKLIYSCRSPLVHPFTTQRVYDEMLRKLNAKFTIPFEKRRKIVYFTRQDADTVNIGRRIINETLLIDYLNKELKKRGRNEELIIFESYDYPNLQSLFKLFNDTKLIFGPHGATFYNSRFAPKQLAVLEILPSGGFYYNGFWEQASLLEQTYGVYYADKVNKKNDMIINDIPNFTKYLFDLIEEAQQRKPKDVLQKYYSWNVNV